MNYKNKKIASNGPTPTSEKFVKKKYVILTAVTAAILLLAGGIYWQNHRPHKAAITASSATKGEPTAGTTGKTIAPAAASPTANPSASAPSSDGSNSTDKQTTGASNTTLLDPNGNFVSNHHPNLSGKPAPNKMQSVCSTTPGALCQITFTKGTTTKSLPSQKTDAGGATYWNWNLQDIGITSGAWTVKATVSLGEQTKSASDALALEVAE